MVGSGLGWFFSFATLTYGQVGERDSHGHCNAESDGFAQNDDTDRTGRRQEKTRLFRCDVRRKVEGETFTMGCPASLLGRG